MTRLLRLVLLVAIAHCTRGADGAEPALIQQVRPIDRWIDLSGKARPVALLCPNEPEYLEAARKLAASLEKQGAARPLVSTDSDAATPDRYNVIALGNVNNSRLIARLYFNHYAYEDSLMPGPGGFSIRTVHDPYPWHGKGNVVVVGLGDIKQLPPAIEKLGQLLQHVETRIGIDYTLLVSNARPLTDAQQTVLRQKNTPSFHLFLQSANQYLKTGDRAYAEHAIATLDRIATSYAENPARDCDWPEETSSDRILATWDAFEECPLLSTPQRLAATNAMLRFMRSLVHHVSGYRKLGNDDLVTWNHTTFPLMGLYFGSRYFQDYYQLPETKDHLRKARACMLAQARSWKPQEDADSYLTITMRHTYEYALAEWNLEFFHSGRMRQYADYVIGICDSAGLGSGFGDSGLSRYPALIEAALPVAYWWYRDPGYLWILQHDTASKWRNPFHQDITAQQPDRHDGVRLFHLDPQLYQYTQRHPFYAESHTPPNVAPEVAFDKIAFREAMAPKAQYLLLDGFARGKHLHFDGNAIIELVDRGERWLIDHDYLTRNTTEHNMLSVLRNGRASQLIPPCAAVTCVSDMNQTIGLVGTQVRQYSGIDWQRSIFWNKGNEIVVLDRMTADRPANYDLDIIWKVEDKGDEQLINNDTFRVRRQAYRPGPHDLTVVQDADASAGKAVLLDKRSSTMSFVVPLPAGKYRLSLRAHGMDSSSDSLFLITGGSDPIALGTGVRRYGPLDISQVSRSGVVIPFTAPTRQLVTLTLRERPPVRVDRLVFQPVEGGKPWVVEAEDVASATPAELANIPATRFWIKWPDPVLATLQRSSPKGMVVPVCKLCQRRSNSMRSGETVELANLLYTDTTAEPAAWRIERIGRGAVLVHGVEPALCAVRGAEVPGLTLDADMLYLSPSRVAWANGRALRWRGMAITTDQPSNLELALAPAQLAAQTPGGESCDINAVNVSTETLRQFLDTVSVNRRSDAICDSHAAHPAKPQWITTLERGDPVRRVRTVDIDQDGRTSLLVAAGSAAFLLDDQGRVEWVYRIEGPCHDASSGQLTPAAGLETVVAGGDRFVHMLDRSGKLISKHAIRGPVWNQNYGDRPWQPYTVFVCDLDGDEDNEILVGTENYELHVYDSAWKQLARARRAVLHGSIDFLTADADGDGKLEIFATDHYGHVQVFGADGTRAANFYTSIGDVQAALCDLDGSGRLDLIHGSSTGDLVCTELGPSVPLQRGAKQLWRFDNYGYAVRRVRTADLDGDQKPEVIVASQSGYLYVLDGAGQLKWMDRAGTDIVEVLVLGGPHPRLVYFDCEGTMTIASANGKVRKRYAIGFRPAIAVEMGKHIVVGGQDKLACYDAVKLWQDD